jgi:RHS repeat-associated protein
VGDTLDRFQWDFDNRMKAADVDQDGTNDLTFTYDALGRRVSKNDTAGSVHTVYVCMGIDMGQVACEYLANADSATTAPQQTYVYGGYVDEPLMKVDASSVKLYYHANRQYSVTAMTDSSGAVVERYAYSPYGVTTILAPNGMTTRATSAVGNSYMYTGRRLDKEFATTSEDTIYYYRARYYAPHLARFTTRDPKKYIDGMSVYEYVGSTPVVIVDPSGEAAKKCGPCEMAVDNPAHVPTNNNCGPGDWRTKLIPDSPLGVRFRKACMGHDFCYTTCGTTQEECDQTFYEDLKKSCALERGWLMFRPPNRLEKIELERRYRTCMILAKTYYRAVARLGEDSHSQGQDESCICVPDYSSYDPTYAEPGIRNS